ncbi:MAG: hypothetical protein KAR80_08255, partial [Rhodospirillaceae bacterium]|nr:hypothetical protein [Rhodospirillaceae bacterium]
TIVANNVVFNPGTDFDFLLSVPGDSMTVDIGYTVEDSKGGEASGTATVTVTGVNDAPVLVADTANTSEGVALNINVLANDKDPDRIDTMTVTSATISSATSVNGVVDTSTASVTIVNNMLQFDPGTAFDHLVVGQTDNAIIDYVVTDSEDNTSTTTTTITVAGTNTGSPRAFHDLDMAQEGGVTVGNVFSGADSDSVTNFHSKLGGDNQSTDGGHLLRSVNHGNVTYTLSADGQSVSASNASAVTFNAGTGNLVINSRLGGTLTITMTGASVGAYSYLAPSTIDFSAQQVITPGSGNDPIWLTVDEVDGNSNGLLDGADLLTYDFGDNLVLSTDVNYSGFSAGTDQGSVTLGRYDQATTAVEGGASTTATKTLTATAGTADDGSRTADLNFASDNQSIWGADAPTEYSIPKTFYGDTWNASSDFSAITGERYWVPGFSYPYPYSHKHYYYGVPYWDVHWGTGWSPGFWIDTRTGLEGGVTTSGKVGVDLEFTANGGAVDSSFGFDTTYQIPTLDQQMAGGYVSLTPNAALQADYAVTHNMPFVSFDVDLVMQANLSAWMKGYILGSTVVDTSFAFGVNETIDLVSLAPVDPAASGYNDYGVKVTEPD